MDSAPGLPAAKTRKGRAQRGRGGGKGRGNQQRSRGRGFGGPSRARPAAAQNDQQQPQKGEQNGEAKAPRKSNAQLAEEMRAKQAAFLAKMLADEEKETPTNAGVTNREAQAASNAHSGTSVDDARDCIICTKSIRAFAFGTCNHCQVCIDCLVKQRVFFADYACVMCKTQNATIVVSRQGPEHRGFETYDLRRLDEVKPTGCFFVDRSIATAVRRKLSKRCPICVAKGDEGTVFSVKNLRNHVQQEHGVSFCGVCLDNRKVFCHEQRLYNSKQLREHFSKGDPAEGGHAPLPPHPKCQFCSRRKFYNKDALEKHERDAHFRCTICSEKRLFPNYERLFDHFARDHFICDNPTCLAQKFIVFPTQLELQSHQVNVHSDKSARKISLAPTSFAGRGNSRRNAPAGVEDSAPASSGTSPGGRGGGAGPVDVRAQDMDVKQRLRAALGNDNLKMVEFREKSLDYRRGRVSAEGYVYGFFDLFGRGSESVRLFKDLIDLLPDLRQRTELHEVMERAARSNFARPRSEPSSARAPAASRAHSRGRGSNSARGRGRGRGTRGAHSAQRSQHNAASMVAMSRGLGRGRDDWPAVSEAQAGISREQRDREASSRTLQRRMNDEANEAAHGTHGRGGGSAQPGRKRKGRKKKVLLSWG